MGDIEDGKPVFKLHWFFNLEHLTGVSDFGKVVLNSATSTHTEHTECVVVAKRKKSPEPQKALKIGEKTSIEPIWEFQKMPDGSLKRVEFSKIKNVLWGTSCT